MKDPTTMTKATVGLRNGMFRDAGDGTEANQSFFTARTSAAAKFLLPVLTIEGYTIIFSTFEELRHA